MKIIKTDYKNSDPRAIEIVNNKVKVIREGEIKTSLLEKEIIKLANNFKKKLDK